MKLMCLPFLMLLIPNFLQSDVGHLKEYEKWWAIKCREKMHFDQFMSWQGNETAISRILARLHIVNKGYRSIIDVGCGMALDYAPLKRSLKGITYLGIDTADVFVSQLLEKGIPAIVARAQNIPCDDSSYDLAYGRYILEHLESYKDVLAEMVRVAKKEVLIVFFIKPTDTSADKMVVFDINGYPVYHNKYSRSNIELFVQSLPKVKSINWQDIKNKDECILHIMINED